MVKFVIQYKGIRDDRMKVGIAREIQPGENRVAAVPDTVARLVQSGFDVMVEQGAGKGADIPDEVYVEAGARLAGTAEEVFGEAEVLFRVSPLFREEGTGYQEAEKVREGVILIGALQIFRHADSLPVLEAKRATVFSLDALPRIARAQSMDVLSAMSNIAGYKSVLLAAEHLRKFFPMLTTAAGSIPPAKVVVIGAGVAGLQAIATARRLGAMVLAFDPRPAAEEQVKSLGAHFVPMVVPSHEAEGAGGYANALPASFYQAEQEILRPYVRDADVVISTALVPGRPAPLLLTESMVREMRQGAVIVDLAIEHGGNCALTEAGQIVRKYGVTLIGYTCLPSLLATHASQLYARNLATFLSFAYPKGRDTILDRHDEIIANTLILYQGQRVHSAFVSVPERETA